MSKQPKRRAQKKTVANHWENAARRMKNSPNFTAMFAQQNAKDECEPVRIQLNADGTWNILP